MDAWRPPRDGYGRTWAQAWDAFFLNHPDVVAAWGHQNGRWPSCTCAPCDPDRTLPRPNVLVDVDTGHTDLVR